MPLAAGNIKVERPSGTLAPQTAPGKPEPARIALVTGGERPAESLTEFLAKIKPWQDAVAAHPATGLPADRAFFDSLYGE